MKPKYARGRRSLLLSAAVMVTCSVSAGAVQIAGSLLIDLQAEDYDPDAKVWSQASETGIPGDFFSAQNPQKYAVAGATAVVMDGTGEIFVGPNTSPDLDADNASHSVEMWVFQGNARPEEAVISWSQRGGPDGTFASFRYGTDSRWGASARWGQPDMGFLPVVDAAANRSAPPQLGQWNLITVVYDGATLTQTIYVNGEFNASEAVTSPPTGLNVHASLPINIGSDREADGLITQGDIIPFSGAINRIRVHGGVLSAADVLANYNEEAPQFATGLTAQPLPRAPRHRYSFNNAAGAAPSETIVPDLIGGFDAKILGDGATFTGSQLALPGGASATQAYVDLPNGILSSKEAATIEIWVTQTGVHNWARIFDIGSSTIGELSGPGGAFNGQNFIMLSANVGTSTNQRFERVGGGITHGTTFRDAHFSVEVNTPFHHVVTYDPARQEWRWFRNGILMEAVPDVQGPPTINDVNVWLGRSNFGADANFQGSYDEVRIYDYTLTESQIYGNFVAGPNDLNFSGTLPTLYTWLPQDGGTFDWNTAGNWAGPGGFPNGATASAILENNGFDSQTIRLNSPVTVNSLVFGSSETGAGADNTLSAGTGGSLTFNAGADGNASLYMPNWSYNNTISAPVTFAVDTVVTNTRPALTDVLELSGTLSGPGQLIKTGTGEVLISGNSPGYNADIGLNGGRLVLSGIVGSSNYTVGAGSVLEMERSGNVVLNSSISGAGAVELTGPAAVTFTGDMNTTGMLALLDGTFTQSSDLNTGILRSDIPTILEPGSFTSAVEYISIGVVDGGSLTVQEDAYITVGTGVGDFNIGDVGFGESVLYMQGGSLNFKTLYLGKNIGTDGVVIQTAGALTKLDGGGESRIGGGVAGATDAWGSYRITGGSLSMVGNLQIGGYGHGVMQVDGGSVEVNGWTALGRFQTGEAESNGVLDVSAGAFNQQNLETRLYIGELGNGVLNVRGTGTVDLEGGLVVGGGVVESPGNGVANLHSGGTIRTPLITQFNNAGAFGVFNFHGGQLVATADSGAFIEGLDGAYVYPGGARIDTNGFHVTVPQPLRAPNGSGVTSIPVANGGSGYLGVPLIELTGGGGTGATAIAQLTDGTISGILVTNPGVGYTTPPAVIIRGGGSGSGFEAGTPVIGANASGGLTKSGAGALALTGASNYTGATVVQAGELLVNGDLTAATGAVTVSNGAGLGGIGIVGGSVTVTGGTVAPGAAQSQLGTLTTSQSVTMGGASTLRIDLDDSQFPASDRLVVSGSLHLADANLVVTATGTPSEAAYIIATWGGTLTGTFSSVSLPPGYTIDYAYNNGVHSRNIALVPGGGGATAFENWISTFFPGETNPAIVGPGADSDNDGAPNFQEFALAGSPNDPTSNGLYFVFTEDSSDPGAASELLLTLAVRSGTPAFTGTTSQTASVDGVTYIVEGSENLVNFNSAVSQVTAVTTGLPAAPAGYEYRTFRLNSSDGLPGRGFLRARVTAP